jgi:hypothetical protein
MAIEIGESKAYTIPIKYFENEDEPMKTAIIPQINEIVLREKPLRLSDFHLNESVTLAFPKAEEIFADSPLTGELPIVFLLSPLEEEEYRITARTDRIEISAANAKGLMYGLFTLSELDRINDGKLVEFEAADKPTLAFRAMSDDISRGQISTFDHFCETIRRLARYKYNTFMPYIEDVFRFEAIPAWGRYSDPVGKDEWKAIIAYAKEWNISVRPIINLLGHFDKNSSVAELQPLVLRRKDGTYSDCLDPRKPEVRDVIRTVLREIVDCFGKGIIHCGGDEPLTLTQVFGEEEAARLFVEHYSFIADEVKKLGCTLMIYVDFFAATWGEYAVSTDYVKQLPADTDFVYWDYGERDAYPNVDALHKNNIKLIISPGTQTWKRFACDIKLCYGNTKGLLKADAGRSGGMIMSSWADGGDTLRELIWPGVVIGANFCWAPDSDYSYEEFYNIYHKSYYGFSEQEAALLDPIYHHDRLLRRKDEYEFRLETWVSPFEPVRFEDRENIGILQAALKKAAVDYSSLTPKRNRDTFDALELAIARAAFTANKIAMLPHKLPQNVEESIPYADRAMQLAGELLVCKELHRRLWFATNRNSEWDLCSSRYDDLYAQLMKFARDCRLRKFFNMFSNQ